jgi:hypothetical protein
MTDFIQKAAAETLPPTVKGELQGEDLFSSNFQALPFLVLGAICHVCHPRIRESYVHPVTVLSALSGHRRRSVHALALWFDLSLYSIIGLFLPVGS